MSRPISDTLEPPEGDELRVSTLELFFDLVFVFTLTQLTALLEHDVSPTAAVQVVLIFIVLFWMYGGYAWLTNQLPPTTTPRRLLLIAGMAAFFICALAIPHAFEDTGVAFGVGYLLAVLVHAGLYVEGFGLAVWRFVPLNVVGALCVIAAAFVDGGARYALWAAPILLQFISSQLSARVGDNAGAGFDIRPGHFVERHGLLLIVAFGESVVAIGIGLGEVELGPGVFAAAVLGLMLAAALWWSYFAEDERRAEHRLTAAPLNERLQMALGAYFYAYIPILLGVITLAAGLELAVGHVGEALEVPEALLLGGGVGLFLAGDVAFRLAVGIRPIAYRLVAAVAAPVTLPIGIDVSALAQLVALVALLVVMLLIENRDRTESTRVTP